MKLDIKKIGSDYAICAFADKQDVCLADVYSGNSNRMRTNDVDRFSVHCAWIRDIFRLVAVFEHVEIKSLV